MRKRKTITLDLAAYRARFKAGPAMYRAANARGWLLDRLWEPPTLAVALAEVKPRANAQRGD